ncbi:hypothetical protein COOONC_15178 [Cooperia oncophora]
MRLAKAIAVTNDEHTLSEDHLNSPPAISCVADITPRDPSYKVDLDHCDLNPKQRCQLQRLLDSFSDVFSKHQYDIGSCTAGKVHIFTTNDPPAKIRPYRVPTKYREELQKHINMLLRAGVMKESHTPWVHNLVVFVLTCVAQLMRLPKTLPDPYPVPRIDVVLEKIGGNQLAQLVISAVLPLTCRVSEEHQLPVVMPCRTFIRGMDHSVNMAEEQQKDEFLQKVFHFKQDNSAVSSFTDQEKASLTDFASKVTVASNGCLYYRRDNSPAPLLLIPSSLQPLHRCATPYHSMGNGATERTFRTFEVMLSKFINLKQEDWDLFLPCVTFCYNTTINEATGESPYFLLFGRDPIFVIDRILNPQEPTSIPDSNGVLDYRAQLVSALQLAWSNAADFARNYKAKMKLGYDKTARPSSIQVGDRVFFKNYTNKQGLARKLCFPWIGQFRVIQMDPPHATIVSITSPQAKPRRVHLNQIKKIFECTGPASTLPTILEEEEELVTHLPTASIKGYDHAVTHNSPTMLLHQATYPYNLRPRKPQP